MARVQGFRKLPSSQQEFRHECFQRDQPQLLSQITRGGTAAAANSDGPAAEIESLKIQVRRDECCERAVAPRCGKLLVFVRACWPTVR